MCDFHSVIVRADGAIGHVPENSHSAAAAKLGWRENTDSLKCFWEAEWNGQRDMPEKLVRGENIPDAVWAAARKHYSALVTVLKTGKFISPFDQPNYADVRREYLARNPKAPASVLTTLATDSSYDVRCNVARNPKAPASVLTTLATDSSYDVRYNVARNPTSYIKLQKAKDKATPKTRR